MQSLQMAPPLKRSNGEVEARKDNFEGSQSRPQQRWGGNIDVTNCMCATGVGNYYGKRKEPRGVSINTQRGGVGI